MDGRSLLPVRKYGKAKFGVLFMDTVTEAGLAGLISVEDKPKLLEAVRKKILISLEKHNSKGIIVHGHQECAGDPVDDSAQKEHIRKAVRIVKSLVGKEVPVVAVFAYRDADNLWQVDEIGLTKDK